MRLTGLSHSASGRYPPFFLLTRSTAVVSMAPLRIGGKNDDPASDGLEMRGTGASTGAVFSTNSAAFFVQANKHERKSTPETGMYHKHPTDANDGPAEGRHPLS